MHNLNFKESVWLSALVISFFFNTTIFAAEKNTMIKMTTSLGEITIKTLDEQAPVTAKNFIDYVNGGFYNETIFHRVIPGFVVQGGGFTKDMQQKKTNPPIINEADNGVKNLKASLSMARTSDPSSASSQFFINLVDNAFLDFTAKTQQGWGYAVFAEVVEGMDVVEKMATLPTGNVGGHSDVPLDSIIIEKAEVIDE